MDSKRLPRTGLVKLIANAKQKEFTHKIGIGVTEHNRPEVFAEFLKNIKKYMPPDSKLVIVDDASTKPVKNADFRFERNSGIARAKNKCLELLQDCEHIFLFDSDCWPRKKDWWKPYVEGREPHYCYIFKDFVNRKLNDCNLLYKDSEIVAYSHARGCMLYFENVCLDAVGGYDTHYGRWGYEHLDISNRIYNVGLTLFRYQDVPGSFDLIYSADEYQAVPSTVSIRERQPYIRNMQEYFLRSFSSTNYCSFLEWRPNEEIGNVDVVIACYFNSQPDPQRKVTWEANIENCRKLIDSMNGQKLVIIHDCFDDDVDVPNNVEMVRVESFLNPFFQRWFSEYQYLREHPEVRKVFLVDATDVEMVNSPFEHMQDDKIYSGSERAVLYIQWMVNHHRVPFLIDYFKKNPRMTLLNCGLVGGDRRIIMEFLRKMTQIYFDEQGNVGEFDMGLYNYVMRKYFNLKIVTGPTVHTLFKKFEVNNTTSWWRHK